MTAGTQRDAQFEQLKEAHSRLTAAWVGAHREGERTLWARPIVDGHMRRYAKELRAGYLQAAESPFNHPAQQKWLAREAGELEALGETFSGKWEVGKLTGGVSAFFGFPGVAGALGFTGLSTAALAALKACLCHLVVLVPLALTGALLLTFVKGHHDKRKLFARLETGASDGVYGAERAAFEAASAVRPRERPLDAHGWALVSGAWLLAAIVGTALIERGVFVNDLSWVLWVYAALGAVAAVWAYVAAARRRPA